MKRMFLLLIPIIIVCSIAVSAHALLIDRGGGLIFDTDLNVTWLQDANYAMTSGYDADGLMNWNEANTWAEGLTFASAYEWRLPTFDPDDPRPTAASSDNELPSLLMALNGGDYNNVGYDPSPFINLSKEGEVRWQVYWTGLLSGTSNAWEYYMDCG